MQVRAFESQQQSRDKEVMSLRQQLVDFQAQSDEKTVIGKLHRHIVQLQVSEGMALRKLEDSGKKLLKRDAQLLRTERKVDEKDNTIFHNRQESRNKTKHLKHTINVSHCYLGTLAARVCLASKSRALGYGSVFSSAHAIHNTFTMALITTWIKVLFKKSVSTMSGLKESILYLSLLENSS